MTPLPPDPDTRVDRLPNGVRVVTIEMPHARTAHVSVFVRTGSQHESAACSGISHVVEHMAFKGTRTRDCQRINLDAELLGAEVNAHTDKDHTAFHIEGLACDALRFVQMLGDIVLDSTFPEAELQRERQVILHEMADDEEDPLSAAFKAFDHVCWGDHAAARPVIGSRRAVEKLRRDDLLAYVQRQYTGANVVVAAAGGVVHADVLDAAQAAFGAMPAGTDNAVAPPAWHGGVKLKRMGGSGQTHVVFGYPMPAQAQPHEPWVVAAALLGEGMSSPLLDRIRERRALAYHVACSADVGELAGQFVVEASTAPEQVGEFLDETLRVLAEQAREPDAVGLARARRQLEVRSLKALQRPMRRLEAAALDLYFHGRVRSAGECLQRLQAVTDDQVRAALQGLLDARAAVALAGRIGRDTADHVQALFGVGEPAAAAPPRGARMPRRAVRRALV